MPQRFLWPTRSSAANINSLRRLACGPIRRAWRKISRVSRAVGIAHAGRVGYDAVVGQVVDVNYPDRSATTILAGGSGE
jgi:hypothetical protein